MVEIGNMQAVDKTQNYRNDVFICYCDEDEPFAEKLTRFLKRYSPPPGVNRQSNGKLSVFKDTNGLEGTEYEQLIEQELLSARKLIVICSPQARKVKTVNQRIAHFDLKAHLFPDLSPQAGLQ